ncbi:hypothetical protein ACIO93_35510 [Streptomyces sp. NPDC087903]|uniref:hypothetical protein n=1 Tax=Streptomyces sp. NPDC087903 TaxID=3365819 RepID=UPI0037F37431
MTCTNSPRPSGHRKPIYVLSHSAWSPGAASDTARARRNAPSPTQPRLRPRLLKKYADIDGKTRFYDATDVMPLDGVVSKDWREAVVDDKGKVERIPYEPCVLVALRDAAGRRQIYVEGATRWRDPEDDLPGDFEATRTVHHAALDNLRAAATKLVDATFATRDTTWRCRGTACASGCPSVQGFTRWAATGFDEEPYKKRNTVERAINRIETVPSCPYWLTTTAVPSTSAPRQPQPWSGSGPQDPGRSSKTALGRPLMPTRHRACVLVENLGIVPRVHPHRDALTMHDPIERRLLRLRLSHHRELLTRTHPVIGSPRLASQAEHAAGLVAHARLRHARTLTSNKRGPICR